VMVSATLGRDEVAMTFEALQAGALTLVPKPAGLEHPDQAETTRQLLETIKLMAEVPVVRRWTHLRDQGPGVGGPRELTIPHPPPPIPRMDRKIRLVAIGASTGGPQTLVEVLKGLPGDLGCPILAVQHIAPGFLPGFVDWLCRRTPLTAKLADPGDLVAPGTVYLAPDSFQMGVGRDGRIQLLREQVEGLGMEYRRSGAPNDSPLFIEALADVVIEFLSEPAGTAEEYGRDDNGVQGSVYSSRP